MLSLLTVGLVQMRCRESAAVNLAHATASIIRLARRGAEVVCLPELFLTPYFCQKRDRRFFKMAEPVPGPTTTILGRVARSSRVAVITSVFERTASNHYYNTAVTIGPDGRLVGKYRKMHIPDDPKHYYDEAFYFAPGNLGFHTARLKGVTVGTLVCWDQWFPEPARLLAIKGAAILFYPTAIGYQLKSLPGVNEAEHEAWQTIQRSHAIANGLFIVSVNRVGLEHKLNFWGTSFVSDPYGRIVAKAPRQREADLLVRCDLSLIAKMRGDWPFLSSRRVKLERA